MTQHADSLVRWVGGKGRITQELSAMFPDAYGNFYEPFLGGGSIFMHEINNHPDKQRTYFISDANPDLIGVWQALQSDFAAFVDELRSLKQSYEVSDRRENYLALRADFNTREPGLAKAARFYCLIKLSFNGLVRYNKKGHFNAAFGGMDDPNLSNSSKKQELVIDVDRLGAIASVLHDYNVIIRHCDYREALESASTDDFAFLDPPYIPYGTREIANLYNQGAFDFHRLIATCQDLPCKFLMCNHDAPIWSECFTNHNFSYINLTKKFTSSSSNRRTTKEIFVSSRFQTRQTQNLDTMRP